MAVPLGENLLNQCPEACRLTGFLASSGVCASEITFSQEDALWRPLGTRNPPKGHLMVIGSLKAVKHKNSCFNSSKLLLHDHFNSFGLCQPYNGIEWGLQAIL